MLAQNPPARGLGHGQRVQLVLESICEELEAWPMVDTLSSIRKVLDSIPSTIESF